MHNLSCRNLETMPTTMTLRLIKYKTLYQCTKNAIFKQNKCIENDTTIVNLKEITGIADLPTRKREIAKPTWRRTVEKENRGYFWVEARVAAADIGDQRRFVDPCLLCHKVTGIVDTRPHSHSIKRFIQIVYFFHFWLINPSFFLGGNGTNLRHTPFENFLDLPQND